MLSAVQRGRRLHAQQRQQLQHVVLDQVAQRARGLVVAGARADPDLLDGGDLDVVDEVAVPDRLEHPVGEPEREHVLDGLLAQVVVDAVDLALVEDGAKLGVQLPRRGEVVAERLLDDHPHIRRLGAVQPRVSQLPGDDAEELRRGGEVEEPAHGHVGIRVDLGQHLAERSECGRVVEGAGNEAGAVEQGVENPRIGLGAGELPHRVGDQVAHLLALHREREPDQAEAVRKRSLVGEVVDRRQELAPGQVAADPEDHHRRRGDGGALEAGGERILVDRRHCEVAGTLIIQRQEGLGTLGQRRTHRERG